jgi:hypothetical protein
MLTSRLVYLDRTYLVSRCWKDRNDLVEKIILWFGQNVGPRERSHGDIVRLNRLRTVRG